jgi:dihydrofolate synthase/folylpolyglutamate synthase
VDWRVRWSGEAFEYESERVRVRTPWLGLPGKHQALNAGAACAAVECVGDPRVTVRAMAAGLREAWWPARLQRLRVGPLAGEGAVWVDAAHNPGGAAVLAEAIRAGRPEGGDRVALVVAMQAVKDIEGVLAALAPVADEVIVCALPDSGGQEGGPGGDPGDIAVLAQALGAKARVAGGLAEGVELARRHGADRTYVCGSVYLCGAALAANGERVE